MSNSYYAMTKKEDGSGSGSRGPPRSGSSSTARSSADDQDVQRRRMMTKRAPTSMSVQQETMAGNFASGEAVRLGQNCQKCRHDVREVDHHSKMCLGCGGSVIKRVSGNGGGQVRITGSSGSIRSGSSSAPDNSESRRRKVSSTPTTEIEFSSSFSNYVFLAGIYAIWTGTIFMFS